MTIKREVVEGTQKQGEDETIIYSITTTPWGGTPVSPSAVVKDTTASNRVVTSTVMPSGSASVAGDIITLPALKSLTAGHDYRVEVKWTYSGNVFECYFTVEAET